MHKEVIEWTVRRLQRQTDKYSEGQTNQRDTDFSFVVSSV